MASLFIGFMTPVSAIYLFMIPAGAIWSSHQMTSMQKVKMPLKTPFLLLNLSGLVWSSPTPERSKGKELYKCICFRSNSLHVHNTVFVIHIFTLY